MLLRSHNAPSKLLRAPEGDQARGDPVDSEIGDMFMRPNYVSLESPRTQYGDRPHSHTSTVQAGPETSENTWNKTSGNKAGPKLSVRKARRHDRTVEPRPASFTFSLARAKLLAREAHSPDVDCGISLAQIGTRLSTRKPSTSLDVHNGRCRARDHWKRDLA